MTYPELAPIISGVGITRVSVENYFDNLPEAAEAKPLPTITKAMVIEIAAKYFEDGKMSLENHNGYLTVAKELGLTSGQVKSVIKEIEVLYGIYTAPEVVEPEPEA